MDRIERNYFVYILSNKSKTLYIGYTDDLIRRIKEHKSKCNEGVTKRFKVTKLVYCEKFDSQCEAENREKQLKNWHREWKINLIEEKNKNWDDLFPDYLMNVKLNQFERIRHLFDVDAETSSALKSPK
jgi:putative endonuclease